MVAVDHKSMKFGLMSALLLILSSDFRDNKSKIWGKKKISFLMHFSVLLINASLIRTMCLR